MAEVRVELPGRTQLSGLSGKRYVPMRKLSILREGLNTKI